ncbi:uncharacterized protein LOC132058576 [Lycium ferocissimum]|uniref:uncharacterized protein LOC132058576 n=1 Tax=Lycium ferocissimum TaxID=112874 RepID=UPI002814E359|nr:uncharacterized protein LOC132058576 [Lycium ferocissimum]
MGNCIVLQEKIVKVIKKNGQILEYKAPIKVHQVLSQFSGHVISNSLQAIDNQHLQPDDNMLGGQIYYLLPQLPVQPPPKSAKKKVKFANDQLVEEVEQKTEVVRIKIVITKRELQELLSSEDGLIKVDDIKSTTIVDESTTNGIGWKPVLDIIPELD